MRRAELDQIYRTHGSLVLRRARKILRDEDLARDAMQDVFVRVIKSGDDFRGEASMVTWLYRITTNLCLNKIRDAQRRRAKLDEQGPKVPEVKAPVADLRLDISRVLKGLPTELSEVAIYYYFDEMDQQEIAELLGLARRSVGYRLQRFVEEARVLLGYDLPEVSVQRV
ncbi:MAG: RNA polymerase sigma factor [Deltaproteobacteria bacterium]|nr:RNA polymerase sigma factor [Deltaproteobacteria bacterium]